MLELNYKYPKLGYGILREAHMKRIILIGGLVLALSGCLSPQQIPLLFPRDVQVNVAGLNIKLLIK